METLANFLGGGTCLLLGFLMLRFKLTGLIAGYNTASREEKEKYDKDKLAKYTGIMMLGMGAALVLGGFLYLLLRQWLILAASWGIFFAITLAGLLYMNLNKRCYKDEYR
ncbi:MAG TPA: DUF3784 domain-containing protein [Feifaniaceae bacterium]|nr:DUF3784 domain-containing protein [Feifaniaceae bacterium]